MSKKLKGIIFLFITAIIWGFAFVSQIQGGEHLGPYTFNGTRFLLGALSLIPVFLIFEKEAKNKAKLKKTIFCGIGAGVILFTASTFQQFGILLNNSSGKSAFITSLYIVIVPFLGLFLKRKTSSTVIFGGLIALVGLYLLCIQGDFALQEGDLEVLIGSIFWAFHILFIDHFVEQISPLKFACTQFFTASFFSLVPSFFLEQESFQLINFKNALLPILFAGLFSAGIAYTCQIFGQKYSEPTVAAMIMSTESLFAAFGGAIILGEIMSPRGYLGCIIIFVGIIFSQMPQKTNLKINNFKKSEVLENE